MVKRLKRDKETETADTIREFESAFRSTWETAKKRGIARDDVETEIALHRKGN